MKGDNPAPTTIIVNAPTSQALPALVNFFCFPGLGQLIQGRILAAIFWWVACFLAAWSMLIGIGFLLLPLAWILCVIDAARYSPSVGSKPTNPVAALIVGLIGVSVLVPTVYMVYSEYKKTPPRTASAPKEIDPPPQPKPTPVVTTPTPQPKVQPTPAIVEEPPVLSTEPDKPVEPPLEVISPPEDETPKQDRNAMRTWTSASGTFTVEAKFAGYRAGKVMLQKADRKIIDVEIEKLSDDDRKWLDENTKKVTPKS